MAIDDLIRTPDHAETVAAAFARGQAAQGIVYTEVLVTALTHVRNGVAPRDLWAALRSGFSAAGPGTRIGIVVDAIRNDGPAELESTFRLIEAADAPTASASGSRSMPARWGRRRVATQRSRGITRLAAARRTRSW